eukprot:2018555-Prymnesium_polylepis.1
MYSGLQPLAPPAPRRAIVCRRPDGGENMARAAIAEIKTRMRAIQQIQQARGASPPPPTSA